MPRQPEDDDIDNSEDQLPAEDPRLKERALTSEQKQDCLNLVIHGVSYLKGKGWKGAAIAKFLDRVDVQQEIEMLKEQYEHRASIQERVQFHSVLQLNKMVPAAIGILAKALRGTVIDESGKIIHRPPERVQYEAAMEVLDRSNIHGTKYAGRDDLPKLDAATAMDHAERGTTESWSPRRREELRKLLAKVQRKLRADADAEAAVDARIRRESKPVEGKVRETEPEDEG